MRIFKFMYLYCLGREAKERKKRSTDVTGHGDCSASLLLMKKPFSDVIIYALDEQEGNRLGAWTCNCTEIEFIF